MTDIYRFKDARLHCKVSSRRSGWDIALPPAESPNTKETTRGVIPKPPRLSSAGGGIRRKVPISLVCIQLSQTGHLFEVNGARAKIGWKTRARSLTRLKNAEFRDDVPSSWRNAC
jgi:hypothetical protein